MIDEAFPTLSAVMCGVGYNAQGCLHCLTTAVGRCFLAIAADGSLVGPHGRSNECLALDYGDEG
ncbi:hypothetical protein [Methylobacterium sp. CM6247]